MGRDLEFNLILAAPDLLLSHVDRKRSCKLFHKPDVFFVLHQWGLPMRASISALILVSKSLLRRIHLVKIVIGEVLLCQTLLHQLGSCLFTVQLMNRFLGRWKVADWSSFGTVW